MNSLLIAAAAAAGAALIASSASAQVAPNWQVSPGLAASANWSARTAAAAALVTNQNDGPRSDAALAVDNGVGSNFATVESSHTINDRLSGEVNRRYVGVTDAHYHAVADHFGGDYQNTDVTWGFSYRFGR